MSRKVISAISAFFWIGGILSGCSGTGSSKAGIRDGELAPCPDSPNCVSSRAPDKRHWVMPLSFAGNGADALADLRKIIEGMSRAVISGEKAGYLHAEFTSAIFRFVDDVEFLLDEAEKKIHVRSASRTGYYDFGVNRKRAEEIRRLWNAPAPPS